MRVVLGTTNMDKVREFHGAVVGSNIEFVPRPSNMPDVDETGETLEENALLKARATSAFTGIAAMSDDSGIFVDALGGAPGVYSARYAGHEATYQDNTAKLMKELRGAANRGAQFRAVIALVLPDGREYVGRGEVQGVIAQSEYVCDQPFGYDPVFVPDEGDGRTFSQMSMAEKAQLSHRNRALADLLTQLELS